MAKKTIADKLQTIGKVLTVCLTLPILATVVFGWIGGVIGFVIAFVYIAGVLSEQEEAKK